MRPLKAQAKTAPPPVPPDRAHPWPEILTLSFIAGGSFILLLYFLREPVYSDDLTYWQFASDWLDRAAPTSKHVLSKNVLRFGFLLSVYLGKLLFGPTMASYHATALVYGIGLILAVYVLTRLFFPRSVALIAAALLITSPIFLEDATVLVPDWPSMFWVVLGLILLIVAARRDEPRANILWGAFGGAALFMALWVKEQAAPLLPILAVSVILFFGWRRAWPTLVAAATSGSLLLGGELVLLWSLYGDPFFRVNKLLGGHLAAAGGAWVEIGLVDSDLTWGDLGGRYLDLVGSTSSGAIVLVLAGLTLLVSVATRSQRLLFFALPAAVGFGFVAFSVGSLEPLTPLLRTKARYLALGWVFFMPLIAAGMWALFNAAGRILKRHVAVWRVQPSLLASMVTVIAGTALAGLGVTEAREMPHFIRTGEDGVHRTVDLVQAAEARRDPFDRIVTDFRTATALRMSLPEDERGPLETFNLAQEGRVDSSEFFDEGDLVVINRKRIAADGRRHPSGGVPHFFMVPPLHWHQVGSSSEVADFRIYHVTEKGDGTVTQRLGRGANGLVTRFHGYIYDHTPGHMRENVTEDEAKFALRESEDARILLGTGRDHMPPDGPDAGRLQLPEPGRFGVRVWLHIPPTIEMEAAWVRTYDTKGVQQRERLRRVADRRGENAVSYAGSLHVNPQKDETFRVLLVLKGSGTVTVDRISPVLMSRE